MYAVMSTEKCSGRCNSALAAMEVMILVGTYDGFGIAAVGRRGYWQNEVFHERNAVAEDACITTQRRIALPRSPMENVNELRREKRSCGELV